MYLTTDYEFNQENNINLIKSCLKELRVSDYQNNITEECVDKCLEDYMNIISKL